ncbi:MAG: hypothetical protein ACLFVQ_09890 [Chitinispirillaceae bacterium]
MHILYFITSHGYGHGVRSCAICNSFPPEVFVTFRTDLPSSFFREEVRIRHRVRKGVFDIGCIQSDGVTVDIEKTLGTYREIERRNGTVLDQEVRWCIENKVDVIVSDITPFAFEIASRAGIPSVAVSNFSWHDIYAEYLPLFPRYGEMLERMARQYRMADLLLALHPAADMSCFRLRRDVPVVGRRGVCRRGEISRVYGFDEKKNLGLIYTGNFGMERGLWHRLETFTDWEFVGVYPLGADPSNYHLVSKERFRYEDLSASADVIISKMGYGVFSESLFHGIPLIYLPREHFAEYPVLDREAQRLGLGLCLEPERYLHLQWDGILEHSARLKRTPYADEGARICAGEILKMGTEENLNL